MIVRRKRRTHHNNLPRELSLVGNKVTPFLHEPQLDLQTNSDEFTNKNIPIVPTRQKSLPLLETNQAETSASNNLGSKSKLLEAPSTFTSETYLSGISNRNSTEQNLQSSSTLKQWLSRLTPKQKYFLKFLIPVLIVVCITAAIVPPVYLYVTTRQANLESSFANFTASVCSSTTCIGQETPYHTSMLTTLYPFDGNANDLTSSVSGTLFGTVTPTYSTGSCYVGIQSISLSSNQLQYVQIPYVNFAQSFTLETWVYLYTVTIPSDYGIFSQCDSNLVCLSLNYHNGRFTLSFDSMNTNNISITGTTVFYSSIWIHVTVVYDAVLFQQRLYVNGQIDAVSRGIVAPYQGTSSGTVTTIGRSLTFASGYSYFNGHIDHFSLSLGVVRTACQIYNDATLVAYYPFDTIGTFNDYSVNFFNGIGIGTTTLSVGRIGQAIYFPSNTSYFQAQSYATTRTANPAFSVSLWVNPANVSTGGTLVHISTLQNGNGSICYDLLVFTSTGALVVQWAQQYSVVNASLGPIIPTNKWIHVAVVYGQSYGVRLFLNGQLSTESLNYNGLSIQDSGIPMYVTIGTNSPWGLPAAITCQNGPIPIIPGQFIGAVDEFRLYNREIDSQEICRLANM